LALLVSPLVELASVLGGDEYDEEAEKQAILRFNRIISDELVKRDLDDG